ncbi:MAG: hypothetical protein ACFB15_17890 [Cyclobacteriaceae bacterium]
MSTQALRESMIANPLQHVPAWTVAAFDPTEGDLPRRSLDQKGLQHYLTALSEAGAPGVLLAASTGWGHARTFEEHQATLIAAGNLPLPNCIKQSLLRIEDPLKDNVSLLRKLQQLDYGIVWTRRGSQLLPKASDEEVADYMLPLVREATQMNLPVGIYSISTVDKAPLKVGAAKLLLQKLGDELARRVVAVKITEPNFENSTLTYLNDPVFVNKKIVQGWDEFYGRALREGTDEEGVQHCGATSGAAACMVYAYQVMYQAAQKNQWDKLAQIQQVVSKVFYSMQGVDKNLFPDLQIAKWMMGLGHPLTESRSSDDAQPVLDTLAKLARSSNPEHVQLIIDSLLIMQDHPNYQSPLKKELTSIIQ